MTASASPSPEPRQATHVDDLELELRSTPDADEAVRVGRRGADPEERPFEAERVEQRSILRQPEVGRPG
jgi:hypothetical protein